MKKKLFLLVVAVLSLALGASAAVIKGQVVDASTGEPLMGATVQPVGGGNGTATDLNGEFSLDIPNSVKSLTVSYVGYASQTVAAVNGIKVALESQGEQLDEVMVVAYGTSKKTSFTGAAEAVGNKKLELRPVTSATKALEGNVSGIQVTSGTGQPGSSPSIVIRGFGSINASNSPLYVVDGIPYDGDLSSINPADIESMTVLKDASAGALYGARGANGVVMIQTKKGKEGKANVTWRSTFGWSNRAIKRYDNVDQRQYVQLVYEGLRNGYVYNEGYTWARAEAAARASLGSTLGGELYNPFKNYTWGTIIDPSTGQVQADAQSAWNEDWYDSVTRKNAFRTEHQFEVSGGSEKSHYLMSLGYLNENGILKTTRFQRYNARVNADSQVTDWFKTSLNTTLAWTTQNFSDYDGTANSNVWYTAQFINPLFPVYLKDAQGKNVVDANGEAEYDWGEGGRPGSLNDFSSLGSLLLDKAKIDHDVAGLRAGMVFGSDLAKYGWAQGLKFSMNFGFDYNNTERVRYLNSKHGNQANAGGMLYKVNGRTQSYTFNQLLTWTRTLGGVHNIDVLVGHEFYNYKYNYLEASKTNLIDGILELRPGTTINSADSYQEDYRINSWLSRLNYNYDNRYYISASLRQDASSRFYKDNHTGTFWSVGANWRVSSESFLKDVRWINNLSVKASYGMQGNDNVGTYYAWQSLYDLEFANAGNKGAIIASLENKDLTWEKNGNLNLGVEGMFLDRRVRLNADWYYKKTTHMLLQFPMALSTGFSGYYANVGNMRNQGIEIQLGLTPVRTQDLEWNVTLMGNTVSNKVLKLTTQSPELISGVYSTKVGNPINTFYMAKTAGVDPATGAQLYYAYESMNDDGSVNGEYITDDYSVAANHKYYMGSRIPDLFGSVGTDLTWKGLSLSVLTTYSIGGKIYDGLYATAMDYNYYSQTWNQAALRRWQKPGDVTDVPRIEIAGTNITNDRYLINASYFAIKNITLSYSLPKALVSKARLQGVRVFGSFDNVALWSHLNGMDPQYNFSGSTDFSYTPNKTLQVGFELNF
ncbi:MAG: TonB-dependent receptor [Sodaliphilus pleomorphus]|uniref:SusC/RagA family TonB-linked outer membrane protein n=1 Tax=Sodaliphilus pleomorphus TaxID=2606626 RepID=UPI0023F40279|nr:TonB-dependent receptor [Sodaliphilus pleomorphus]MDD7066516.1 TonB-dependent receptor [Sodaliphilus pleomorphus]MDY2833545.1 TonB-dependent receptor [Sodaliphilus pleomorphus]